MTETGWFADPFGTHEGRWFSAGRPTDLVRDGLAESREAPAQEHFDGVLETLDPPAAGLEDLARADGATRGDSFDVGQTAGAAAWAGEYGPAPRNRPNG